jgi:two-component system LytT family response regulator
VLRSAISPFLTLIENLMNSFNTIIVDNNPEYRKKLSKILHRHPDISEVDQAGVGSDAIIAILRNKPEVIFLDLATTHPDCLEILKEVWKHYKPHVIFTKQKTQKVPRSISACCLTKPYEAKDVANALDIVQQLGPGKNQPGIEKIISLLLGEPEENLWLDGIRSLLVEEPNILGLIPVECIAHFRAWGEVVSLHTPEKCYRIREDITSLEQKLDRSCMIRTSPSDIINIHFLEKLEKNIHGEYFVRLSTGETVRWDPGYRENIKRSLARVG